MRRPARGPAMVSALLAVLLALAGCTTGSSDDPPAEAGGAGAASTCGYLYEWLHDFRFPLQPDPHAAYSYVVPKVTDASVGYEITGDFPYAAWTEWMVYTALGKGATPFSVVKDSAITPDEGSVNPFVVGTPVLSPQRSFRLLVLPSGTAQSSVAASLRDVPASNVLTSPTDGRSFVLANRVYNAFPGYNQGGAAGPTDTAFPTVRAVDLTTGLGVDCSGLNLVPDPKPPTEMPSEGALPAGGATLADGTPFGAGPGAGSGAGSGGSGSPGAEYAPTLDPAHIEFTRPPLLPGADVSSVPPPDSCAGYLGAATSTSQVGLIRIPKVATWFDTTDLDASTPFAQEEVTYVSLTQYGAASSTYAPGQPTTASLANEQLLLDPSGGSTVVVWPRSLSPDQQSQLFAYAREQGWALLRAGEQGEVTSANLFLRMKGTSESYQGGFTPTADRAGVPCYFDDHPGSTSWSDVTGDEYVASATSIGPAAPQGVNCSLDDVLGGACLTTLEKYISSTGGSYGG